MDCNKTIDFFAEAKRLCDSRTACSANEKNKERCPLFVFLQVHYYNKKRRRNYNGN